MEKEKKCQQCGSKENLFINSTYKEGVHNYLCRKCNTERVRKYRKTKIGKKNVFNAVYKSIKKHQNKQNCRAKTQYLIKKGVIKRKTKCDICSSNEKVYVHHNNYEDHLDITFVCMNCHRKIHNK